MTHTVIRPDAPFTSRRVAFTARGIGSIKAEVQAVDWTDAKTPGLSLRVSPGGARTWYVLYRKGRTARRAKLGTWPAVGLAKARQLAREQRLRVETEGADPAHERQAARDIFSVANLSELYIEQYAKAHKRTWRDDQWRLDAYVLPAWRSRPVRDIARGDVHALLDKIVASGKPIQANRVQALVSKLWNVAIDRGHAEHNPAHRMAKRAPERVRATVLDDAALMALWQALEAQPGDAADAIRLRLLTGARGGEVHQMAWTDLDAGSTIWTLPAEKAKNKRASRVPMTAGATALLEARREARAKDEARVFPGLYHQRDDLRALASIHGGAYRWHDLRRTVATRLAELGVHEDTISRVLNHAKRGVTSRVYIQHEYDAEKRIALEAWARELARIVAGPSRAGADVVPMRRA